MYWTSAFDPQVNSAPRFAESCCPLESDVRYDVYDVQPLLGKEVYQYLYFAASVFWRAPRIIGG